MRDGSQPADVHSAIRHANHVLWLNPDHILGGSEGRSVELLLGRSVAFIDNLINFGLGIAFFLGGLALVLGSRFKGSPSTSIGDGSPRADRPPE